MQTLEGHSLRKTVEIWDTATGACMQTLEGHSGSVTSVAFSPDSKLVASGSHDETVKIWDAATGACMQTLEGHSRYVNSSKFITSWSDDARNLSHQHYRIGSEGRWITRGSENWMWLPPGCRPGCRLAVTGSTIAIGCESGRVLIMTFPTNN
jgi:WD40 repeat protein